MVIRLLGMCTGSVSHYVLLQQIPAYRVEVLPANYFLLLIMFKYEKSCRFSRSLYCLLFPCLCYFSNCGLFCVMKPYLNVQSISNYLCFLSHDYSFHLSDCSPCWFALLTAIWNFAANTIFLSYYFDHLAAQLCVIFLVLLYSTN